MIEWFLALNCDQKLAAILLAVAFLLSLWLTYFTKRTGVSNGNNYN